MPRKFRSASAVCFTFASRSSLFHESVGVERTSTSAVSSIYIPRLKRAPRLLNALGKERP